MNNKRRSAINKIKKEIISTNITQETYKTFFDSIYDRIYDIQMEEQDAYDNMPENLQFSIRGISSDIAISALENAMDIAEEIQEYDYNDSYIKEDTNKIIDALDEAIFC